MLTANYLCVPYDSQLQQFVLDSADAPYAPVLIGAIDAPEVIAAGSTKHYVLPGGMIHPMPTAIPREWQQC